MTIAVDLGRKATKQTNKQTIHDYRLTSSIFDKKYCKFGNFRENFIFANNVKRHICDPQSSRLRHEGLDGGGGLVITIH